MNGRSRIQQVFDQGWKDYCSSYSPSDTQSRAAWSIMNCHTSRMGFNSMLCTECGHMEIHYNSCRNRNCPVCQTILKESWIDSRRSEVINSAYFHLVATVPAELNPVIYANQDVLYPLLHQCVSETILQLSADKKYLGAMPGVIQLLHTWGQELNYHPHIHCIVSGNGLSRDLKLVKGKDSFFIPAAVMRKLFRGKFLASLQALYSSGSLNIPHSCTKLINRYEWNAFRDSLYKKDWNVFIKETFNGNGNAIEYLGRYTHRVAVSNSRIRSVADGNVTFTAFDYKTSRHREVTVSCVEFIRRFMLHILPPRFQKIRYYGFLGNRIKKKSLSIIFRLQGHQSFTRRFANMSVSELLQAAWGYDIHVCKACGCRSLQNAGRCFPLRC